VNDKILVIVRHTAGNSEVGNIHTTVREFDFTTTIEEVYKTMRKLGNWDIVIPLQQEVR